MNDLEAIIAGAIQGTIEWLPISSEAQTMLYFLNYLQMDPQIALSYAFFLHTGTMMAVIIRFRSEFVEILKHLNFEYKLTKILIIATLSTAITALPLYFLLKSVSIEQDAPTFTLLIGFMLIITGIIIKISNRFGEKEINQISEKDMIITGIAQGFAILPGISRSGITIATLLARKVNQETSLVISFLMSVPATLSLFIIDFGTIQYIPLQTAAILVLSSLFFGYISMNVLLSIARRTPFWIFCILFGVGTILFMLVAHMS